MASKTLVQLAAPVPLGASSESFHERAATAEHAAETLDVQLGELYNVRAVLEGLRALGERIADEGKDDDAIARLAVVGQGALQQVIDALFPVRDALRGLGVSHGE